MEEIPTEFGMKHDKFQLKQTSIQFENDQTVLQRNERSFQSWEWWIKIHCKYQTQCNTHNKECLVNISNQHTQGIRRNKSQTESKQNRKTCYSKNKTSSLFFLISFF